MADNEDTLLRSVARQNAESIRTVLLQAEAALRERANPLILARDAIFTSDGTVKYRNRGAGNGTDSCRSEPFAASCKRRPRRPSLCARANQERRHQCRPPGRKAAAHQVERQRGCDGRLRFYAV
jgi:hypothetical protein